MSDSTTLALEDCPSVITLPVLWGDMDSLGHVNNVVLIRWFESSRIAYLEKTVELSRLAEVEKVGPILAAVNCSYKRQLRYPDTVRVGCRVTRIGRSSLTMSHVVFSEQHQATAAVGESVVVIFNYETQRPVAVSNEIRQQIDKLQPE